MLHASSVKFKLSCTVCNSYVYYSCKVTCQLCALWIGNTSRAPIYFNGCSMSLSAFRTYKLQMYLGVLRLSLHSICSTWSVLDISFYDFSIPFASKVTLLHKVYRYVPFFIVSTYSLCRNIIMSS